MDYGNLKVPENVTPKVQAILDSYKARNKEIENAHKKNIGRIWLGSALSGASAHPILNIPYVGTGLGGALYELGQGITEGDKLPELAKRIGTGFAIGETVGAIPYAGKYANKLSGGKIGNALTAGVENIASTPLGQKVIEIAPKVEDLLMTDIKAFNPNKQTAYHGSPYEFDIFSNEAIGTGEGAQAHGYGHYVAKDKGVADEYRRRLTKEVNEGAYPISYEGKLIDYDTTEGKVIDNIVNNKYKYALDDYSQAKDEYLYQLQNSIENPVKNLEFLSELARERLPIAQKINPANISEYKGHLYKLSIPKDDVMLREGATFAQQPKKVQNGLENYFKDLVELNEGGYQAGKTLVTPGGEEQLLRDYIYNNGDGSSLGIYRGLADRKKTFHESHKDPISSNYAQQQITNDLSDYGIKGISYNGGIDGEARVIFNPDDIEIVRKFYNQPQAMEYFQKFHPNFGAVVNSIETNPVNTKEWKQYAKNNLIGNSVDVPGYTTVNFTNKNLGKDYPYNMPEYETLLDDLTKSKYAFSTNYNNEADRFYDHLVNDRKGLFDYLIEVIQDPEGNIHHNYKMMKNINRGDKP